MNLGQTLLSIGSILLLSVVILRVNANFLATGDVLLASKLQVLAVSLGTSVMEEATGKAFDSHTVNNDVSAVTGLDQPAYLGKAAGENYPDLDDIDDYNNLVIMDSSLMKPAFKIICKVNYVNPASPDVPVTSVATWHKRLSIMVTSPSMIVNGRQDTVKLSTVFSYWHFR